MKLPKKENKIITLIAYEEITCEICHSVIPDQFVYNKRIYNLLVPLDNKESYIILEYNDKKKNNLKYVYIIYFISKNILTIGKSASCDITIGDNSISRDHAEIILLSGKFYLKNKHNKYGTFISLDKDFPLISYSPVMIQYNDCIISYRLSKTCLGSFMY